MTESYQAALRRLLSTKGVPMEPGPPNIYGWTDVGAQEHARTWGDDCSWVVPPDAVVVEETIRQFIDTLTGSEDEVGLQVAGVDCACGRYLDVTLRYVGSAGDAIQALLG